MCLQEAEFSQSLLFQSLARSNYSNIRKNMVHGVFSLFHLLTDCLCSQLSTENQEVWEESLQCLSLLVQLYGGEGYDCLSPSCLQSFSRVLRTHMHTESLRIQRTTLRIIKRLVSTVHILAHRHKPTDINAFV